MVALKTKIIQQKQLGTGMKERRITETFRGESTDPSGCESDIRKCKQSEIWKHSEF